MIVIVIVTMRVMRVPTVLGQEVRVDFQLAVEVEALQIEHVLDRHDAEIGRLLRRARVHVLDAVHQCGHVVGFGEVGLADEDLVGEADLPACFLAGVELRLGVHGVDQGQHRVEQIAAGDLVVHEEGLRHRAGVGQAGGFDDHALEVQFALAPPFGQVGQRGAQVFTDRAAHAAVVHLDDLLLGVGHQDLVVDVLLAEFVFDDGDLLAMCLGEHALEQRGLAGSQEAGEDGDGNQALRHGRSAENRVS